MLPIALHAGLIKSDKAGRSPSSFLYFPFIDDPCGGRRCSRFFDDLSIGRIRWPSHTFVSTMVKGKSKSECAPNVKAAVGTAALLAAGASAKGLRGSGADNMEVVVASAHLSSKQGINVDPPHSNLIVVERVVAETAPFQMISQQRSMEEYTKADETEAGIVTETGVTEAGQDKKKEKKDKKSKDKKKKKDGKKKDKKKRKESRQLGMEPTACEAESDDSETNEEKRKRRFRWI
eukprot:scaffold1643_cov87-Skeletonema_dohrnii-CCMP3373.AAC.2